MAKRALSNSDIPDEISQKRVCVNVCEPVGANYMHADGWASVIEWLDWHDIKRLVATGDMPMRRRAARFARQARIAIGLGGMTVMDSAALRLMHNTHERINLRSIKVAICLSVPMFEALTPECLDQIAIRNRDLIAIWNRIAPCLGTVVKVSLQLDRFIVSTADDDAGCGEIKLPPQTTEAILDFSESGVDFLKRGMEHHRDATRAVLRECVIVGCGALKHVHYENPYASSLSLHNFRDLEPAKIASLSASQPPLWLMYDFFIPFTNLTELSLCGISGAIRGSFPMSLTKLKLSESHRYSNNFIQDVFNFLPIGNRITSLTLEHYCFASRGENLVVDHLTTLFKTIPALESYELFRHRENAQLCSTLENTESNLNDVAAALNSMPSLKRVPFQLFNDKWDLWCSVYAKLTEPRRQQLQLSLCEHHPLMIFGATGEFQKMLTKGEAHLSNSLPDFPRSIRTIYFGHYVPVHSTAPLTCFKSLPFLTTLRISISIPVESTAQPSVDQWVKQSLPPWLTSLSLTMSYAGAKTSRQQPFEDVGITWLPPCLQTLSLTNVLPVKRMAYVLPPSVSSLDMHGHWVIGKHAHLSDISDVQLLDARDWYKMRDGNWRESLSISLYFSGVEFDCFLKSYVARMRESDEWRYAPNHLKPMYHDTRLFLRENQTIHSVSCEMKN